MFVDIKINIIVIPGEKESIKERDSSLRGNDA
jgi:hypothetical protein